MLAPLVRGLDGYCHGLPSPTLEYISERNRVSKPISRILHNLYLFVTDSDTFLVAIFLNTQTNIKIYDNQTNLF